MNYVGDGLGLVRQAESFELDGFIVRPAIEISGKMRKPCALEFHELIEVLHNRLSRGELRKTRGVTIRVGIYGLRNNVP